ncbi:MAG TPA: Wzt carbohydrate-binding domain-containing protein, partial [Acidimicrobiales bacterium]|nr:Wzt carbohydrate-binding domain-containing protein [Acidimicrobiales bacterium]
PASIQVTADEMKNSSSDSSRPVRITDVTAFYPEANERRYLLPRETLIVRAGYQASEPSAGVVVTIEIRLDDGTILFRTDTEIMGLVHDVAAGPGAVDFHFDDLPLFDGSYLINVGITGPGGILYDWREPACTFEVMNPGRATGVVAVPVKVAIVPTELVESA